MATTTFPYWLLVLALFTLGIYAVARQKTTSGHTADGDLGGYDLEGAAKRPMDRYTPPWA